MTKKNKTDSVFVLTVFCFFTVSVFLVIMFAASTYTRITDISRNGQNERIILSYIRTKIRSADSAGAISVGEFHGLSALFIEEFLDEREFITVIYNYNGMVYELFCEKDSGLLPEDGISIIAVGTLGFEQSNAGLIRAFTENEGFYIYPRSGIGGSR